MPDEEYSIGHVSGWQVSGKKFYSQIFQSLEEAQDFQKGLEATEKKEQTEVRSYKKPKVLVTKKKGRK